LPRNARVENRRAFFIISTVNKRRLSIGACVACVVAVKLPALAQPSAGSTRRIGFLAPWPEPMLWLAPLRKLGWVEGRNLVVERRITNGVEGLASAAADLVRIKVDAIVTDGTNAARAASNATRSIPVVMAAVGDPVGAGLVASLARPGGNLSGYSILSVETARKRAQLVRDLLPSAQRVAVVMDASNEMYDLLRRHAQDAYRSLALQPVFLTPTGAETLVVMLRDASLRADAVDIDIDVSGADAVTVMRGATQLGLPVIAAGRSMLEAGAVMAFDLNRDDLYARVAATVDKVLRGTPPATIPVEQPENFTLMINLKAAQALGVTIPQSLLLRADEVIR
jgi:putative ABC transport system substrate-binding protein